MSTIVFYITVGVILLILVIAVFISVHSGGKTLPAFNPQNAADWKRVTRTRYREKDGQRVEYESAIDPDEIMEFVLKARRDWAICAGSVISITAICVTVVICVTAKSVTVPGTEKTSSNVGPPQVHQVTVITDRNNTDSGQADVRDALFSAVTPAPNSAIANPGAPNDTTQNAPKAAAKDASVK